MRELDIAKRLADDELALRVAHYVREDRRVSALLLAHLSELDERGLYRDLGYESIFQYAVQELHLSESEAGLRIYAAKFARKFPSALEMLGRGELHLTAMKMLAPVLTDENAELLELACHKSKPELQLLIAKHCPQPDVPHLVRRLPDDRRSIGASEQASHHGSAKRSSSLFDSSAMTGTVESSLAEPGYAGHGQLERLNELHMWAPEVAQAAAAVARAAVPRPTAATTETAAPASTASAPQAASAAPQAASAAPAAATALRTAPVAATAPRTASAAPHVASAATAPAAEVQASFSMSSAVSPMANGPATALLAGAESMQRLASSAVPRCSAPAANSSPATPLREGRYKIQFTAGQRDRDLIQEAQDLYRNQLPNGDIAVIVERALEMLVTARKKELYAQTEKPRPRKSVAAESQSKSAPRSRHIPNDVKRAVFARDRGQCRFVNTNGDRCCAKGRLEFHHVHAFGLGGAATVSNIMLLCRAHNELLAERDFSREHIQRCIRTRRDKGSVGRSTIGHVPERRHCEQRAGMRDAGRLRISDSSGVGGSQIDDRELQRKTGTSSPQPLNTQQSSTSTLLPRLGGAP